MFNILLREFISNSALLFGVRCLVVRWRNETSVRIWADARGLLQSCAVEIALFSWRSKATIAVVVCRRPSRIPCVVRIELYIYTVQCGLTVRQCGRAAGYYADRWHATAANWQEYTSARLRMIKVTYTVWPDACAVRRPQRKCEARMLQMFGLFLRLFDRRHCL